MEKLEEIVHPKARPNRSLLNAVLWAMKIGFACGFILTVIIRSWPGGPVVSNRGRGMKWTMIGMLALPMLVLHGRTRQAQNLVTRQNAIRSRIASLPPDSHWRELLARGIAGDGVHYVWMDDMRKDGVRLAMFNFKFGWTLKGMKLDNWRLASERFFHDYDGSEVIIDDTQLDRLNVDGLPRKLRDVALARAMRASWPEYPSQENGTGYISIRLADNEWLPVFGSALTQFNPNLPFLMRAALLGDMSEIKKSLQNGTDVNSVADDGNTALVWAAIGGDSVTLDYLLDHGANIDANPKGKGNALVVAVRVGQDVSTAVLLRRGADPNSTDAVGNTVLSIATSQHRSDLVALLKKAGAHEP